MPTMFPVLLWMTACLPRMDVPRTADASVVLDLTRTPGTSWSDRSDWHATEAPGASWGTEMPPHRQVPPPDSARSLLLPEQVDPATPLGTVAGCTRSRRTVEIDDRGSWRVAEVVTTWDARGWPMEEEVRHPDTGTVRSRTTWRTEPVRGAVVKQEDRNMDGVPERVETTWYSAGVPVERRLEVRGRRDTVVRWAYGGDWRVTWIDRDDDGGPDDRMTDWFDPWGRPVRTEVELQPMSTPPGALADRTTTLTWSGRGQLQSRIHTDGQGQLEERWTWHGDRPWRYELSSFDAPVKEWTHTYNARGRLASVESTGEWTHVDGGSIDAIHWRCPD